MSKSDAGKGDSPRPFSVKQSEFGERFDKAFGKKEKPEPGLQDCSPAVVAGLLLKKWIEQNEGD